MNHPMNDDTRPFWPGATQPWKYKSELCYYWTHSGWCKKAQSCPFAHGESELRDGMPRQPASPPIAIDHQEKSAEEKWWLYRSHPSPTVEDCKDPPPSQPRRRSGLEIYMECLRSASSWSTDNSSRSSATPAFENREVSHSDQPATAVGSNGANGMQSISSAMGQLSHSYWDDPAPQPGHSSNETIPFAADKTPGPSTLETSASRQLEPQTEEPVTTLESPSIIATRSSPLVPESIQPSSKPEDAIALLQQVLQEMNNLKVIMREQQQEHQRQMSELKTSLLEEIKNSQKGATPSLGSKMQDNANEIAQESIQLYFQKVVLPQIQDSFQVAVSQVSPILPFSLPLPNDEVRRRLDETFGQVIADPKQPISQILLDHFAHSIELVMEAHLSQISSKLVQCTIAEVLAKMAGDDGPLQCNEEVVRQAIKAELLLQVQAKEYTKVLTRVLELHSLDITEWACSEMDPKEVFMSDQPPPNSVILSLIHQLALAIGHETELRVRWLQECAMVFDPNDTDSRQHTADILEQAITELNNYLGTSTDVAQKKMVHVVTMMLQGLVYRSVH